MSDSSSMTLGNCSIITQASTFTDIVAEQKSLTSRATALKINFDDLKEKEDQFEDDDLDFAAELSEYNTARETLLNDIRNWFDRLGMQIGQTSKDQDDIDNRTKRALRILKLMKKKLSTTSPLGPEEVESKKNRLWLSEEQTQIPPEILNQAAEPKRYQLRSMKKSISEALSSPFRNRSSTPDAQNGKKKQATIAAPAGEKKPAAEAVSPHDAAAAAAAALVDADNLEEAVDGRLDDDRNPEKGREGTINISSGWPTLVNIQEKSKSDGEADKEADKETDKETDKTVLELDEVDIEILKATGVYDMYEQCRQIQLKAAETKKELEKEEKEMLEKKDREKENKKDEILIRIEKSLERTRAKQEEMDKKRLKLENIKKQQTDKTKSTMKMDQNTQPPKENNKTKQNKTKTKQNDNETKYDIDPSPPSKRSRIRTDKSATKAAAKAAAEEEIKAAKEAVKKAKEAAMEAEELDSDDEEEGGWKLATNKKKAKKQRKTSSDEDSSETDSPPPKNHEQKKQKTLKDIQLESLVRSRMIEMRPKTEEEKFADDGKINYFAFKNKFQSMSNIDGCNPFDALSEILHWVRGNARRVAEAYQGSDDPVTALKDLWVEFDTFYDLCSQTPLERVAPILSCTQQIRKDDLDGHMSLLADLKAIKREAEQTNSEAELDGHNIVRDIFNKRLPHMAEKFFERQAERKRRDKNAKVKYDDLIDALSNKAQTLKSLGKFSRGTTQNTTHVPRVAITKTLETPAKHCYLCSASHPMDKCNRLSKMTIEERVTYLRKEGICFKCFDKGHVSKECTSQIIMKCEQCTHPHHDILHNSHIVLRKLAQQKTAALASAEALALANKDIPTQSANNSNPQNKTQAPPPLMPTQGQKPKNI